MPSYGLPYTGSKNRLAEKIIRHLPEADTLVDVFFASLDASRETFRSQSYKYMTKSLKHF